MTGKSKAVDYLEIIFLSELMPKQYVEIKAITYIP
jgi:hypothetical protein